MSDALKRLIDAVEAGDLAPISASQIRLALGAHYIKRLSDATHGNLNSAKALHKALLPDWRLTFLGQVVNFHDGSTAPEWSVRLDHGTTLRHVESIAVDPAHAWLLAILRAYQQVQA